MHPASVFYSHYETVTLPTIRLSAYYARLWVPNNLVHPTSFKLAEEAMDTWLGTLNLDSLTELDRKIFPEYHI